VTIPAWIAIGAVVLGLLLLLVVGLSLRRRLRPLKAAVATLQSQASEVEALQHQLETLQPRVEELTAKIEQTTAKFPGR